MEVSACPRPGLTTHTIAPLLFFFFFALQHLNGYAAALEIFISARRDNAANDKEDGSRRDRYSGTALK